MSLTDVVSSTLSTVISNIIIVVNDGNSSGRLGDIDGNGQNNFLGDNSSFIQSPVIPLATEIKYVYVGQGVAHGLSQEKIISVMCMLAIFSIFGCLGNGLVLYVFTKKSDKVTSTIFILALAWTDFFTCLIIMPFTAVNIGLDSRLYLDFLCKVYQFLITSNVPLSAFIMVAIAVDRYFSICHPFMRVITPRRARVAIICMVLVACTLGSITTCIYGVWQETINDTTVDKNSSIVYCNETSYISFQDDGDNSVQNLAEAYSSVSFSESSTTLADKDIEILITNNSFQKTDPGDITIDVACHPSGEHHLIVRHVHEGLCVPNELIFSERFTELYQKIYISFYIISLLAVFTLYFFIYRSVAERREWRRKQKSFSHSPMTANTVVSAVNNSKKTTGGCEHLELAPQSSSLDAPSSGNKENGSGNDSEKASESKTASNFNNTVPGGSDATKNCGHENGVETSDHSLAEKKTNRERRDFNFLANIRTAIMLFVVALVFIISFLPAWLMATSLIDFEIVIFYMHFIYNVANPVIYAFMNQSFRKELKRVFQRGTHLLRGG